MTREQLLEMYRAKVGEAKSLVEKGEEEKARETLKDLEKIRYQLEILDHEEFLQTPGLPSSTKFVPASSSEGHVEVEDWGTVEVKTLEIDPVHKVPREAIREVKYFIPRGTSKKEYHSAFEAYLRKGSRIGPNDAKALTEGMDEAGGFLVPSDYQASLIRKIAAMSTIRANASVVTTLRDMLTWPRVKESGDVYSTPYRISWTGEVPVTETSHEVTHSDSFGLVNVPVHTAMASLPMSNNILEDASFDIAGFVTDALAESFALGENEAFLTGNGVNQPYGLVTAGQNGEITAVVSGNASSLTADGLISLAYALPSQYESNAKWLMNKSTESAIRKMKSSSDLYYWPIQSQVGAFGPVVPSLLGYPIVRDAGMPDIASNAYPIIFGDLRGYLIVDRVGISIQRLTEIKALQNMTVFVGRKRVGGYPFQPFRFRIHKIST